MKTVGILLIYIGVFITSAMAQTGPGGIGGHEDDVEPGSPVNALWLRAGDLTLSAGEFVTRWPDASGYNHVAVPGLAGKEGIFFEQDRIHGHPWVRFFGINYLRINNHEVLDGGEGVAIFTVVKRDSLIADKYMCNTSACLTYSSNILTKRAHWNAWSHVTQIPMTHEALEHAYELRWEQSRGADGEFHPDTMTLVGFLNGNLPDGAGADVYPKVQETADIDASYLISFCYSNHEESYGSFIRVNANKSNRSDRSEGNPNPLLVGPVVKSSKDLWLGGAEYDPPGAFGEGHDRETCPTCTETGLFEGAMSEIIIFKGTLWHTHVIIIENYLSLKYDLSIDAVKYYDDDVFTRDMVGIGNEFGDDKKHSMSTSHALTIQELNGSLNAPKNYIFTAHNGESTEWVEDGLEHLPGTQRWGRMWKLTKMGEADIRMSFNFITAELNLSTSAANVARHRIAYKETLDDDFTIIRDVAPSRVLRTLHFEVPNELLKDGYYTVLTGFDASTDVIQPDLIANSLEVFPSPARDQLSIRFNDDHTGPLTIRLLDVAGREVMTVSDQKTDALYEHQMDVSRLQNGIYFLELTINGQQAVKRVIKQ